MKKALLLLTCLLHLTLSADKVVIVGGGPVGLATAIEAASCGHDVTIFEKRTEYTRRQTLLLDDNSLALLKNWQIPLDRCSIHPIGKGKNIGLVIIQELQQALKERARALGVKEIINEYKNGDEPTYDFLIGADGLHSTVREHAKISLKLYATAVGRIALIQNVKGVELEGGFTPIKAGEYFVMKIPIPPREASVVCMQSKKISSQSLEETLQTCMWHEEKQALQENRPIYSDWFELPLQQASEFCNEDKEILLVGDAAASASYLRGGGLNTGFQTAQFAGMFFRDLQAGISKHESFTTYNSRVKKVTDRLIQESLSLYSE